MKKTPINLRRALATVAILTPAAVAQAQSGGEASEDDVYVLPPFEVSTSNLGYSAETTLAGNRLATELRDIGSAVTVVTKEFMNDVGATNNTTLLQYTTGTEVGGIRGNFSGAGDAAILNEDTIRPNQNTRVRGLAAADNTRDFFRTDVPWDGYNVDRIDLQRGANSILFGQGSPAGIINASLKNAMFSDFGSVEARVASHGTIRGTVDVNRELIDGELAVRVAGLYQHEKFQQEPAFSKDKRVYAALRYEPEFLRVNGARTILKVNVESGSIDSNNPRYLPPADAITPWFTDLNQATYNQFAVFDHLTGRPGHGQIRVNLETGQPNPAYEPYLGTFASPSPRNGPAVFFNGGNQATFIVDPIIPYLQYGIGPSGAIDNTITGLQDNGWVSIVGTQQWAINARAPYAGAGLWKNNLLTDASIFDFYNNLIDGDTKSEWQDFWVVNASLAQTFMDDKIGISADYNREHYENGIKALLPGEVRLQIDPMAVYGNGTADAGLGSGEPFANGTPNPNVGRPFVSTNNAQSNRSYDADRETVRATGFVKYDFADGQEDNALLSALGEHTLTAFFGSESLESDSRQWQRYGIFDASFPYYNIPGYENTRFNLPAVTPVQVIYLGDSLMGRPINGAYIPSVGGDVTMQSGSMTYFDSHWNSSVDPAAPWANGYYYDEVGRSTNRRNSTQSENPANYVGWTTTPFNIVDAEASAANRDRLTTRATLEKRTTDSQALVWQGKWLSDAIVTTYGWRKDVAKSWAFDMSPDIAEFPDDRGSVNFSPDYYKLPDENQRVDVTSRSYGVVGHLFDLPYIKGATEKLPFDVSVYYNRSTNFKPDASRVGIYGEQLASPSGKTVDRGVMVATRDGRYSVRVNRYETYNFNASSTQISAQSIGSWMTLTQNYANVFDYNIISGFDATLPGNRAADADVFGSTSVGNPMYYNFHMFNDGRTFSPNAVVSPDGAWVVDPTLERKVISTVREFQRSVDPRFWEAWGIDTFGDFGPSTHQVRYSTPAGFAITEDNVSKGWEIEFTAQPTDNWRVALNASKTDARRLNIGNENIRQFFDLVGEYMRLEEGDGLGRLNHYWGTEDVVKAGKNWFDGEGVDGGTGPGSEWRMAQLVEGTRAPELREWRVNLITNYDFSDGLLKGVNVGGGMRYQSSVILTYLPVGDPNNPLTVEYDFEHPVEGPSETNFDLWIGYQRQITDSVNWRVQLNVYNAFNGDDELIPITAQPDGSFAAYRIAPKRSWAITNTFEF